MSASLKGRSIILTGAAGGHGKAIARMMARERARLVLVDRDPSVAVVARSIKGVAWSFVLDVVDEGGWTGLVQFATDRLGGIDGLVNNAVVAGRDTVESLSPVRLRGYFDVNVIGALNGIRAVAPAMRANGGGAIVNVASISAMRATPGLAGYGISKWALRGLSRNAAVELAPAGIRVNLVLPGASEVAMIADRAAISGKDAAAASVPAGRVACAEEVARAIIFAASDAASYLIGSEIVVDGGWTA